MTIILKKLFLIIFILWSIVAGIRWETSYPRAVLEEGVKSWWIPTTMRQYVGPDTIMVDDHYYVTYVQFIWLSWPTQEIISKMVSFYYKK